MGQSGDMKIIQHISVWLNIARRKGIYAIILKTIGFFGVFIKNVQFFLYFFTAKFTE
jgi:hypothetical protein